MSAASPELPPPEPPDATAPGDAEERAELERVLAAPAFAGALSHQRLLRHLGECTLAGRTAMLRETAIAIDVLQRPADRYDPRSDSIVRVEARRLRDRLQRHYASAPAGTLQIGLPKGAYRLVWTPRAALPRPDDARQRARELVERGQYFLRQGHEDGHRRALARFEAAVKADATLADGYSGVARAWLQLVATNLEPPRPGVDHALAAVHRALQLQPQQTDARVLAAQLTHRFAYDWPAAQRLFDDALQLAQVAGPGASPGAAYVQHAYAMSLMMRGDHGRAESHLAQARQIDPLHLSLRAHQALLHLYRRQWAAAESVLQALLDLSPDNVLGMSLLAYVALCQGEAMEAWQQYRQVDQRHPQLSIGRAGVAQALAALGRVDEARAVLQQLQQASPGRYLSPYQLAMVEMRLHDSAAALQLLSRAVQERDPNAWCLWVDPAFDELHDEAAYRALVQQVHGGMPGTALSRANLPGAA